ncbi:disulfide bond formation protein B [Deefgea piscis]|uniref:disulfide bond formation protein B n=1 Tax=Deefgea piscis TaxID=2739061 RepID=UPI001C2D2F09|nr:disulfide bond formation protein B [Deefgea piscis]
MSQSTDISSDSAQNGAWYCLFICWLIAATSTFGSLFFSEVMHIPPCVLCWYQRIPMYSLLVIFSVALFPLDRRVTRYALPLAVIGCLFAFYHLLIYSGVIPEGMQPCTAEVSCAKIDLELIGFITIPLMSVVAFSLMIGLLLKISKGFKK